MGPAGAPEEALSGRAGTGVVMADVINLFSDTQTLPTEEMLRAIASAELGDDMLGEDPTVNRLEARAAELTGKEAALLVTSGTQGNLVSLMAHGGHGDEVLLDPDAHAYFYEADGSRRSLVRPKRALVICSAGHTEAHLQETGIAESMRRIFLGDRLGNVGFTDVRMEILGGMMPGDGTRRDLHLKGSGRTPFARGGDHSPTNLTLMCKLCRARHNRHYAESVIMPRPVPEAPVCAADPGAEVGPYAA